MHQVKALQQRHTGSQSTATVNGAPAAVVGAHSQGSFMRAWNRLLATDPTTPEHVYRARNFVGDIVCEVHTRHDLGNAPSRSVEHTSRGSAQLLRTSARESLKLHNDPMLASRCRR